MIGCPDLCASSWNLDCGCYYVPVCCVYVSMSAAVGSAVELPHSQSASDLQECTRLPLVIRERDVEYQVSGRVLVCVVCTVYSSDSRHRCVASKKKNPSTCIAPCMVYKQL